MKRTFLLTTLLAALCACTSSPVEEVHLSDYVSTLCGTQSDWSFSSGNTYPATAMPWGMNFWTPVTATQEADGWAYTYGSHKISCFKQTHQPSPWINDYGAFSIMPFRGSITSDRASWFSHESETARPYLYSVYLADHDTRVEIAPTERAAIIRITYPEGTDSRLEINPYEGGHLSVESDGVSGYSVQNHGGVPENFHNYFTLSFDTAPSQTTVTPDGKAILTFETVRGQQVVLRVASSFISAEQAKANLAEVQGRTFEEVCLAAQKRWDEVLGRIRVSGGNDERYRTFYSCLYRCLLFPRKFYELTPSGEPVHYSPYNGKVESGFLYTDTGFWDTFRALFPLINLVYPETAAEVLQGLANIARENEFLPEWASPGHRDCMIGNNSASVVADGALQGLVGGEDLQRLYDALVYGTSHVHPRVSSTGRKGWEWYNTLGYIPYDVGVNENVARTLEYAYDDWCLWKLSQLLDRPEEEQNVWLERSGNWKNVFDPQSNLMRGRNADGSFQEPFSPYKWGDAFTEGNAWHYTWSVFHDIPGLMEAMGGEAEFTRMLDSVFVVPPIYDDSYYGYRIHEITEMQVADMGNYAHGNQPAQHMLYLYDWTSQPWKGQERIRETMNRLYRPTPDAYCGDEDNGQTSAWYVFSALGFYPVCPAGGEYALGTPLFKRAEVSLQDGKTLVVEATGGDGPYVRKASWNGVALSRNFVQASSLKSGGTLRFELSAEHD